MSPKESAVNWSDLIRVALALGGCVQSWAGSERICNSPAAAFAAKPWPNEDSALAAEGGRT